ncbi:transposase, partial [Escherichia coli]|uniref:transposase n=1 Tax=Escherichia coli TaxID=562 RepID=UPI0028DECC57
ASDRFCLDQLCAERTRLGEQLRDTGLRLRAFAAEGSSQEQADRELLRSIPGVGEVLSEVILAELAGPRRFSSIKQVVAY